MIDLSVNIAGIRSPNPFWLSSGPPTNTAAQVLRAFEAGWGGAVWKTLTDKPTQNVSSRYGGIDIGNQRLMGLNNIELISDRPLADNLREITQVKKAFPDRALIASLMVESKRDVWHDIVKRAQNAGVDGIELNFGCPHGMSERGQGSVVGQVPDYAKMITSWAKEVSRVPVLVKLTPNVTDITAISRAVKQGGGDGISLINTLNSIMGVDLETLAPQPAVAGQGTHGGYAGPSVKPIALHMVSAVAKDKETSLPVSGIGGIRRWEDAVEFMLLGASTVQVCTAVMHRGFGVVKPLLRGLSDWMSEKGFQRLDQFRGKTLPRLTTWGDLDLNYKVVAHIDQATCIHCGICYAACEDGCYQAVRWEQIPRDDYAATYGAAKRNKGSTPPAMKLCQKDGATVDLFTIKQDACVGCNMCALACPVEGCITMKEANATHKKVSWNDLNHPTPADT
jgi:dihydropyrimidine dehydrogenase (NAD+) subunit PreA